MLKYIKVTKLVSIVIFFTNCTSSDLTLNHKFDSGWNAKEPVDFEFNVMSEEKKHNLYFVLRHNDDYAFSNIFLITKFKLPEKNEEIDTIEFVLSEPSGKWKGKKQFSTIEHKLSFKNNLSLNNGNLHFLSVRNSMRLNNTISPIQNLENVLDLGLLIEPVE